MTWRMSLDSSHHPREHKSIPIKAERHNTLTKQQMASAKCRFSSINPPQGAKIYPKSVTLLHITCQFTWGNQMYERRDWCKREGECLRTCTSTVS